MNLMKRNKSIADVLVILSVFCVFALTAVFVIVFGARIYRNCVANNNDNYIERTIPLYLTTKIRSFDEGNVFVSNYNGTDILTMQSERNGFSYNTYVYAFDNSICEYTGSADVFDPEFGTEILPVDNLLIEETDNNLYHFTVLKSNKTSEEFYVNIKSDNGGTLNANR